VEETELPEYFGDWLKLRRNELDLTQAELAQRAGCSVPALRKIESGDRRPSKQLAGLLAKSLEIPTEDQTTFIRVARGESNIERLPPPTYATPSANKATIKTSRSPGNLPSMLNPFIGRELELTALGQLLCDPRCRLLTLTGPGGIGKTRLAIEVARCHKDLFPDGIWLIPLTPLNSSEYLIPTIADALNFKCHGLTNPRGNLINYLSNRQTLLVMDNAEHLADSGELFAEILAKSPQVKILVTSRERLNLLSEWVFEIQGLPVPPIEQVAKCEDYSAVALFLQSARRIKADFSLRDDERQWVVRICHLLEGLPLGIELSAAWVGMLSCEEIAKEIESNIDFLVVSMHDLPERHRSLRATLDHSWRLLSPDEKSILSRLSIFQGSFRREAAEVICDASLTILSSLMSKSLLRRTDRDRYDLHELIRRYAAL
jgi:transcriptional regulator with XRE-family HTH domain